MSDDHYEKVEAKSTLKKIGAPLAAAAGISIAVALLLAGRSTTEKS